MPPPVGAKCHPSARNTLLPIAQKGHSIIYSLRGFCSASCAGFAPARSEGLFRAVRPLNLHPTLALFIHNPKPPRVAAHLAVLHHDPVQIRLKVNLDLLAAV